MSIANSKSNIGYLHSFESMGLVDGPGIRTVFFLQGCPLRCGYCHNPDSQSVSAGTEITVDEVLRRAKRYRPYHGKKGGITFSGGEPLLQGAFLEEALTRLRQEGFHIAVDTSGFGDPKHYDAVFPLIDTMLLDVKAFDDVAFQALTKGSFQTYKRFLQQLSTSFHGSIWIRHVMLPGYTDDEASMRQLVETIRPIRHLVERIEILPYHVMGVEKYEKLQMPYRLEGLDPMDTKRAKELERYANRLLDQTNEKTA